MPQLPSGRHVGLVSDPIFDLVREGDWGRNMQLTLHVHSPDELAPIINVTYYTPVAGESGPGKPFLSGLMLADIGTDKCDWSAEDVAFFEKWLASDVAQKWLKNTFEELTKLTRTVKTKLPENLHGILEDDD